MTQVEKSLLLQDLCARLPYGVMCHYETEVLTGEVFRGNGLLQSIGGVGRKSFIINGQLREVDDVKPYLRPMSSMTEEEVKEIQKINWQFCKPKDGQCYIGAAEDGYCSVSQMSDILKYLVKHHFDYLGLIPIGLALEATKGMYN